tara:strand:+ start:605 stop:1147 length:543 start_codon:yes stop_codon:yes gene_type:complete
MNFISRFASVLVGSSLIFAPTVRADEVWNQHVKLWNALGDVGISVLINDPQFCVGGRDGSYYSRRRMLIVCQDNASKMSSREVKWTDNDLDTLRHESHHVVQDCVDGELGDNQLDNYFSEHDQYLDFVVTALTEEQVESIVEWYEGASDKVITNEIEAFAVAKSVDADTIADVLLKVCSS